MQSARKRVALPDCLAVIGDHRRGRRRYVWTLWGMSKILGVGTLEIIIQQRADMRLYILEILPVCSARVEKCGEGHGLREEYSELASLSAVNAARNPAAYA
jgi:hypothetical protein